MRNGIHQLAGAAEDSCIAALNVVVEPALLAARGRAWARALMHAAIRPPAA